MQETTLPLFEASYLTEIHKIMWISIALIMARNYYNERFQSYLASPNEELVFAIGIAVDILLGGS